MCSRRSFVRSLSPSVVISVPAIPTEPERRLVEPREDVHQGRLARARRAHDGRRLGRRDVDRHAAQGVDGGVSFSVSARHVACSDDRAVWRSLHPTRLLSLSCERERIRRSPTCGSCQLSAECITVRLWRPASRSGGRSSAGARRRTRLLAPVSDEDLVAQVSPRVPPLVWSYAHVARFEELWILRTLGGRAADPGRPRPRLRRVPARALERREAPDAEPHGRARLRDRRARAVARRARARRPRGARRPRQARLRLRARAPERAAVAGVDARDAAVPDEAEYR